MSPKEAASGCASDPAQVASEALSAGQVTGNARWDLVIGMTDGVRQRRSGAGIWTGGQGGT